MKKERHPVYWLLMAALALLLALGVLLLVKGIQLGPNQLYASAPVSL